MNKPLIGITTGERASALDWGPKGYFQNHQYSDAVLAAGGLPVLLPYVTDKDTLHELYGRLDGLLLAGGADIDPAEYGEQPQPKTAGIDRARDQIELHLARWAVADDKPLLAICRGFQVLNVSLGGTLIQDIADLVPGAQNHELSTDKQDKTYLAHRLHLDPDCKLARIIGATEIAANTHHHQAVCKPAPGLRVTARARDGVIEAAELPASRFILGVQCHPEPLTATVPGWLNVFRAFVRAGNDYSAASTRSSLSTDVPAPTFAVRKN